MLTADAWAIIKEGIGKFVSGFADPLSFESLKTDAEKLPKTFSAVKVSDTPDGVEISISSAVPPILYPGLRMWVGQMVEATLSRKPPKPIDWSAEIRAYDWQNVEPFLHYEWKP
jgi:hypothetical protein